MPEVPIIPRYLGIVTPVANHLARREIKRQMRAQGLRITRCLRITRYADVIEQARVYLAEHPELFDKALALVRASPWHRAQAEREERDLERERRKRARAGVLEKPTNPPVLQTDNANAGTEKTQEFPTTSAIFRGSRLLNAD